MQKKKRDQQKMRALWSVFLAFPFLIYFSLSYIYFSPTKISSNDLLNHTHPPPPKQKEFSLLIGILTRADFHEHRHFLRLLYSLQSSSIADVDMKFILCNLTKEEQSAHVALEQLRYNDIIVLNCTENMNNGKTYTYFSSLPNIVTKPYDYVMKADDDTYIRLEALSERLRNLSRNDLYYGFGVPCSEKKPVEYMSGMGYVLSWDIVEWVRTSEIPANNTIGPEDKMVGKWLALGGRGRNVRSEKPAMYDFPGTNGGCSHALVPDTVAVHRLKRWDQWLSVVRFFNLTEGLT